MNNLIQNSVFLSALLYYSVYFFAYQFFKKADKSFSKRKTKLFLFAGMMLLCLFAGLRGTSVGTDTYRTVLYRFNNTNENASLGSVLSRGISEPLLVIIPYFIKKIINDYRVFLFVLQALTIAPIGVVTYKLKDRASIHIMMLVYMLLFFPISLNVMRQSIAAAWLLLALVSFLDKNYLKAAILTLLSTYFHGSVLIGVVLFAVVYFLFTNRNKALKAAFLFSALILSYLILSRWRALATWVISEGILTDEYSSYIGLMSGETVSSKTSFHYRTLVAELLRLFSALIVLASTHRKNEVLNNKDIMLYLWSILASLAIFSVFALFFHTYLGDRFTLYLDYSQIPLYGLLIGRHQIKNTNYQKRRVLRIPTSLSRLSMVYCFAFNLFMFVIIGYGDTVPYIFG